MACARISEKLNQCWGGTKECTNNNQRALLVAVMVIGIIGITLLAGGLAWKGQVADLKNALTKTQMSARNFSFLDALATML